MENASKALIIAGAILLSILIIAIGMYIYNSSQNSIATAGSQISAQEIQSFNHTWEMYEGVQTGTNVRSLISKMSANANANKTEKTRLPDLCCNFKLSTIRIVLSTVGNEQGQINNEHGLFNFNDVRAVVQPRHQYRVFLVQSPTTALVYKIFITYNSNESLEQFLNRQSGAKTFYNRAEND